MFNFLNSTVLFAAAAAVIPLLIHLFSKRRVKVVEFSSLKHLKQMQKRQVRRLKIRQLLLLLLRMLIILAVVLAFARPTTEGGSVGSHASVSAVIVFDNSASMSRQVRDGNLFEIARKRVRALLDSFGESDEIRLIVTGQEAGPGDGIGFVSAAAAREQLERLRPGYTGSDLQGGLERAEELMGRAVNLNREIYIVSDMQRAALPESGLSSECEALVYAVSLPREEHDNCGITGVDFGGQLVVPGHDFDMTATVKNYGNDDRPDLIASLYLDGHRVAQTDVSVGAGSETTVRFTRSVSRGGFHSGRVELSDDKFAGDNSYYFGFRIPDQFNVLLVNGDPVARYVSLALAPSGSLNQYWSVKEIMPDGLAGVNLREYDVIVLAGAPRIEGAYAGRIKSFVRRGKALLVTYSGETEVGYFNGTWSEVTGVRITEPARRDFSRAGYYTLETVDYDHPVFNVFDFAGEELPEVRFYTLPKTEISEAATVAASFSGGRPALVETVYGDGRVLTFTGPLGPNWSDMTGQAFFVPFVSRMAEYLASDLSGYDLALFAGDQINRTVAVRGALDGSLELVAPDSARYYLAPDEESGSLVLQARPTDYPGIYSIRHLGQEVDRFAVNVNPAECDLTAVDVDRFATAAGAPEYRELPEDVDMASAVAEFRFGKELWQVFLWLAVIMLLVEMLLSRRLARE